MSEHRAEPGGSPPFGEDYPTADGQPPFIQPSCSPKGRISLASSTFGGCRASGAIGCREQPDLQPSRKHPENIELKSAQILRLHRAPQDILCALVPQPAFV